METLSIIDLVKHPKLLVIYFAFLAIGWCSTRFFPDDCHKDNLRLEQENDRYLKRGDSIQASKDALYERYLVQKDTIREQKQRDRKVDSLLQQLGNKADNIIKNNHVEHH